MKVELGLKLYIVSASLVTGLQLPRLAMAGYGWPLGFSQALALPTIWSQIK